MTDTLREYMDFIDNLKPPNLHIPDSDDDFGMYAAIDVAFGSIHDELDRLRRNQGRVAFVGQNTISDFSKAAIQATLRGSEEDAAFFPARHGIIDGAF